MKMVSLKLPKKDKAELEKKMAVSGIPQPEYPYDSRITIRDKALKELTGIYDNVEVGDLVVIKAKAKVTEVSERESQRLGDKKKNEECRVEFQLTDVGIEKDTESEAQEGFDEEAKS